MPNLHTKSQVLFTIYYSSVFIYLRHIYKEQICANPFFLFKKSSNAFIFMYVIRCLRKEGCSQAEVDHLFSSIVLPNNYYYLCFICVWGLWSRANYSPAVFRSCFKHRYISKKLEIGELLKVQDHRICIILYKICNFIFWTIKTLLFYLFIETPGCNTPGCNNPWL